MTDNEKATCPVCGKEVNSDDLYCRHCGSEIKGSTAFSDDLEQEDYTKIDLGDEDYGKTDEELESELRELDYVPKKKSGFLVPVLVIFLVLSMVIGGVYMIISTDDDQHAAVNDPVEVPDTEDEVVQNDAEESSDEIVETSDPDEEQDESDPEEEMPPDYELLEEAMEEWLEERINDPDVILLQADELEDFDQFFDDYDLEEDNIIVYMVDSKEDEFATVLMGPPFSEWSIKAVFIWRDGLWDFLREETMG